MMDVPKTTRLRRWLLAALAAALAFTLCACGANIDTTLTLGQGAAGTRVMKLTLSAQSLSGDVQGGIAGLDTSIQAHVPSDLSYSGITQARDGSISATFTITFTSQADYLAKVTDILRSGQVAITPQVTLLASDSGNAFKQGSTIKENFTSKDLMAWLANGLVDDGVVPASAARYVLGGTVTTQVVINGRTQTVKEPISLSSSIDNGFTNVAVTTTYTGTSGPVERTITYQVPAGNYAANPNLYDGFFASATPPGAKLGPGPSVADAQTWTMSFSADSASVIVTDTNQALSSTAAVFSPTWTPSTDHPLVDQISIPEYVECAAICADGATVTDALVVPSAWTPAKGLDAGTVSGATTSYAVPRSDDATSATLGFSTVLPVQAVSFDTQIEADGAVTQTVSFQVSASDDAANDQRYRAAFVPPTWMGSLVRKANATDTTYVATLTASSLADYANKISGYLPGTALTMTDTGSFFRTKSTISLKLDVSGLLGQPPAQGISQTLTVWGLVHVNAARAGDGSAPVVRGGVVSDSAGKPASTASITLDISGWTMRGLVLLSLLGLVVLAGIVAAVVFRHRLVALLLRRRPAAAARGIPVASAPEPTLRLDGAPDVAPRPVPDAVTVPLASTLAAEAAAADAAPAAAPPPPPETPPETAAQVPSVWVRPAIPSPSENTSTLISPFARIPADLGVPAQAWRPPETPAQPSGDVGSYAPADVDFGPGAGMGSGLDDDASQGGSPAK